MTPLADMLRIYRQDIAQCGTRYLAKVIGISPATLNRIENGKECDMRTFMKILNWMVQP